MKIEFEDGNEKFIIPEKFKNEIESLENYIGEKLGDKEMKISVTLQEMLEICPKNRKRVDAYSELTKFLSDNLKTELKITSRRTK